MSCLHRSHLAAVCRYSGTPEILDCRFRGNDGILARFVVTYVTVLMNDNTSQKGVPGVVLEIGEGFTSALRNFFKGPLRLSVRSLFSKSWQSLLCLFVTSQHDQNPNKVKKRGWQQKDPAECR